MCISSLLVVVVVVVFVLLMISNNINIVLAIPTMLMILLVGSTYVSYMRNTRNKSKARETFKLAMDTSLKPTKKTHSFVNYHFRIEWTNNYTIVVRQRRNTIESMKTFFTRLQEDVCVTSKHGDSTTDIISSDELATCGTRFTYIHTGTLDQKQLADRVISSRTGST